jgi:hypothetical protein
LALFFFVGGTGGRRAVVAGWRCSFCLGNGGGQAGVAGWVLFFFVGGTGGGRALFVAGYKLFIFF